MRMGNHGRPPRLSRRELLRLMNSREFHEIVEEMVRQELVREKRGALSVEQRLARAVAIAVRTSVELLLPLTRPDVGLPEDVMSAPPPFPDFPEEPDDKPRWKS
jgi:hypothetical protein